MNLFGMSGNQLLCARRLMGFAPRSSLANMANSETTRMPQGGAYRRQLVVFRGRPVPRFSLLMARLTHSPQPGVQVDRVLTDMTPMPRRYEPGHPDAISPVT